GARARLPARQGARCAGRGLRTHRRLDAPGPLPGPRRRRLAPRCWPRHGVDLRKHAVPMGDAEELGTVRAQRIGQVLTVAETWQGAIPTLLWHGAACAAAPCVSSGAALASVQPCASRAAPCR